MILETDRDELLKAIKIASQSATANMDAGIEVEYYEQNDPSGRESQRVVGFELTESDFEFSLDNGAKIRCPHNSFQAYRDENGYNFILKDDTITFRIKRVVPVHFHLVRVYTADTDAYGMVYYAHPLRFMEAARVEMFRNHGITPPELETLGFDFPVAELEVKYLSPARADDLLEVRTELLELAGAHLLLDQSVRRQDDGCICYDAYIKLACISTTTGKPTRIPKELNKLAGVRPLTNE